MNNNSFLVLELATKLEAKYVAIYRRLVKACEANPESDRVFKIFCRYAVKLSYVRRVIKSHLQ